MKKHKSVSLNMMRPGSQSQDITHTTLIYTEEQLSITSPPTVMFCKVENPEELRIDMGKASVQT